MFLVSSCSCFCPIHRSQVLSQEWRCSWSSSGRRCSNYFWVINKFIAYWGASYIRGLTLIILRHELQDQCKYVCQYASPFQWRHRAHKGDTELSKAKEWWMYTYLTFNHYNDFIMCAMVFQITGVLSVCSAVCSGADQRKHQRSTVLVFVRGIHRWIPLTRARNTENVSS